MECIEFRRRMLEVPADKAAALAGHRLACRACADWAARQRRFDARVADALAVPVPDGLAERVRMRASWSRDRRRRWPAVAAVLVVAVAGLSALQSWRTEPLGEAVVDHLYHEPELLLASDGTVDTGRLGAVLARVGGSLDGDIGKVTHAGLCLIRGRLAAHLVVAGGHGPIAVLVMPGQGVDTVTPVGDGSMHGSVLPAGNGSVAIIGFRGESLEALADRIRRSLNLEI